MKLLGERPVDGATAEQIRKWHRYHGKPSGWFESSQDVALQDPRGVIIGGGHGGLGNQLWAAAMVISAGAAANRLPALPCNSCYRWEALREIHCLPFDRGKLHLPDGFTKRVVSWGESPDASIDKVKQYSTADRKTEVVQLGGFGQSFYAFEEHWQQVCWALRPRNEVQEQAQAYLDDTLAKANVTRTINTRLVMMHLRRGDYVAQSMHGLLTADFYTAAIKMVRSKAAKENAESVKEGLVVVILTEQENVEWCKANLKWNMAEHGVRQSICADAQGKRCRGEMVDMFALSLGDYLVIANSTFSWWSHFFRHCLKNLAGWFAGRTIVGPDGLLPTIGSGQSVFPHRWYASKVKSDRQKMFDFMTSDILVPSTPRLFEGTD